MSGIALSVVTGGFCYFLPEKFHTPKAVNDVVFGVVPLTEVFIYHILSRYCKESCWR